MAWPLALRPSTGLAQSNEELPLPPTARPLDTTPVEQSLNDLLQDGFDVVAMSVGIAGNGLFLKKGRRFVMCNMGLYGNASKPRLYSDCQSLIAPAR